MKRCWQKNRRTEMWLWHVGRQRKWFRHRQGGDVWHRFHFWAPIRVMQKRGGVHVCVSVCVENQVETRSPSPSWDIYNPVWMPWPKKKKMDGGLYRWQKKKGEKEKMSPWIVAGWLNKMKKFLSVHACPMSESIRTQIHHHHLEGGNGGGG